MCSLAFAIRFSLHCVGQGMSEASSLTKVSSEATPYCQVTPAAKPDRSIYPNVNVINLSLRRSKNDSFGVGVEIAIGIETHAMALFVDFDSDPDIDFDGFSPHGTS